MNLSPREQEVADLIAAGNGGREIADALHIKLGTVYAHKKSIHRKTGTHNDPQIVRMVLQRVNR